MALRNYMYYKHQDDLKDKIAHGLDTSTIQQQILHHEPISLPTEPKCTMKKKAKKLTPTQIRKLQNLKLQDENHHDQDDTVNTVGQGRSKSISSINSSSSELSLIKSHSYSSIDHELGHHDHDHHHEDHQCKH